MVIAGILIGLIGCVAMLVGCIVIAVSAFRTSILWGIGVLIIPFVGLVYALVHKTKAKFGVVAYVAGYVMMFLGAILTGLTLGPELADAVERADRVKTTAVIRNAEYALNAFHVDNDRLPTNEEGLAILVAPNKPAYFDPPAVPIDAWGNPIRYTLRNDGEFSLLSYGADGQPGGTGPNADISSTDDPQ